VGSTGRVVGIDVDGKLGSEALSVLQKKGYQQCSFIEGKVESLEEILNNRFDLVFARLLLLHLNDPVLALRKMYNQVKPGGRILVQDYYFPVIDSYPTPETDAEFKKVFFGVYDKAGKETRMGVKLPGYFMEAGIGAPDGTDVTGFLLPSQAAVEMIAAVYRSVLPIALKYSITTEERGAWFFEEIQKSASLNYYTLTPLLVSAWKQKAIE
jgi:ubiquinone/menaquinone biosynthesis C-methylase UbiE